MMGRHFHFQCLPLYLISVAVWSHNGMQCSINQSFQIIETTIDRSIDWYIYILRGHRNFLGKRNVFHRLNPFTHIRWNLMIQFLSRTLSILRAGLPSIKGKPARTRWPKLTNLAQKDLWTCDYLEAARTWLKFPDENHLTDFELTRKVITWLAHDKIGCPDYALITYWLLRTVPE